jgi:hypothetical protein
VQAEPLTENSAFAWFDGLGIAEEVMIKVKHREILSHFFLDMGIGLKDTFIISI